MKSMAAYHEDCRNQQHLNSADVHSSVGYMYQVTMSVTRFCILLLMPLITMGLSFACATQFCMFNPASCRPKPSQICLYGLAESSVDPSAVFFLKFGWLNTFFGWYSD